MLIHQEMKAALDVNTNLDVVDGQDATTIIHILFQIPLQILEHQG